MVIDMTPARIIGAPVEAVLGTWVRDFNRACRSETRGLLDSTIEDGFPSLRTCVAACAAFILGDGGRMCAKRSAHRLRRQVAMPSPTIRRTPVPFPVRNYIAAWNSSRSQHGPDLRANGGRISNNEKPRGTRAKYVDIVSNAVSFAAGLEALAGQGQWDGQQTLTTSQRGGPCGRPGLHPQRHRRRGRRSSWAKIARFRRHGGAGRRHHPDAHDRWRALRPRCRRARLLFGDPVLVGPAHLPVGSPSTPFAIASSRAPCPGLNYHGGGRPGSIRVTHTNRTLAVWRRNWTASPQTIWSSMPTVRREASSRRPSTRSTSALQKGDANISSQPALSGHSALSGARIHPSAASSRAANGPGRRPRRRRGPW